MRLNLFHFTIHKNRKHMIQFLLCRTNRSIRVRVKLGKLKRNTIKRLNLMFEKAFTFGAKSKSETFERHNIFSVVVCEQLAITAALIDRHYLDITKLCEQFQK